MIWRRLPPERLAFALLLTGLLILHVVAIFTENINWDEFALLSRAADTLRTGQLRSGGRPGLGTLVLIPFVDGCSDSVAAIRSARLLWVGFTVALVSGFWTLLARGLETEEHSGRATAFGVALLVLVPAFLRFSIQIRTDQPAIALGLWGGVALLASRRRSPWALLAGMLFGIGFLFSQKAAYVAALAGLLVVGDLLLRRELRVQRELIRAGLCLLGGVGVLDAYREFLPAFVEPVAVQSVSAGLGAFGFYRADFGYAFYVRMLPTLIPHLVLLALLLIATGRMLRNEDGQRRLLLLAWAILALGIVVGLFHAGAFPYFWMTLGLFPATAATIALKPIQDLYPRNRDHLVVLGFIWIFLVAQSGIAAAVLLRDSQHGQRESLAFIERNFTSDQEGFHPERALFCRDTENPLPVMFGQTIGAHYWGPDREANGSRLIGEFRQRPVAFILDSFRLRRFPPEITAFWQTNYRLYYESVWLPALTVDGREGARRELAVLVPGTYRLQQPEHPTAPSIRLDGQAVESGGLIDLEAGTYSLELLRDLKGSTLLFVVDDPPKPTTRPFYKPHEVIGFRW
jgi:hypothetical protein